MYCVVIYMYIYIHVNVFVITIFFDFCGFLCRRALFFSFGRAYWCTVQCAAMYCSVFVIGNISELCFQKYIVYINFVCKYMRVFVSTLSLPHTHTHTNTHTHTHTNTHTHTHTHTHNRCIKCSARALQNGWVQHPARPGVAACCSVLQCVAMRPLLTQPTQCQLQLQLQLLHVAAWCSVLQCVAVQPQLIQPNQCQLLLPNVATWCNALQCVAVQPQLIQPNQCQLLLPHVAAWCSLLQCSHSSHNPLDANCSHVAVRCSMLQRVAVRLYAKNAALFHLKQIPVPYKHKIVKALQHTATHCNTLQHTATHCNTLQHTATHPTPHSTKSKRLKSLQHTATLCNTPRIPPYKKHKTQVAATHCNTLQHAATHCNTLQHTATHHTSHPTTNTRPKSLSCGDSSFFGSRSYFTSKSKRRKWWLPFPLPTSLHSAHEPLDRLAPGFFFWLQNFFSTDFFPSVSRNFSWGGVQSVQCVWLWCGGGAWSGMLGVLQSTAVCGVL